MQKLSDSVWPADMINQLERSVANQQGVTLFELMQRAGMAVFQQICQRWPGVHHWLILCGHGNNGGDGYVVACLAKTRGAKVTVIACQQERVALPEVQAARQAWLDSGGTIYPADTLWPEHIDIVVDALLGNGLNRAPEGDYAYLIEQASQHVAPVFAIDIPSGLMSSTGAVPGKVIEADITLALIALKPGLLTGRARDVTGCLQYDALGLETFLNQREAPMIRIDQYSLSRWLKPRKATSHKGDHGRLLVIGGDEGMAGAIRMAGEAALRAGAGLVRVLTRSENIAPLLAARPELMVKALHPESLLSDLDWADVIVAGPGLGQQVWGQQVIQALRQCDKPMLWDADALNLLAIQPDKRQNRILTPHPGEAARLLNISTALIENDRVAAVRRLAELYGGVVVLKGAGTLIASEHGVVAFADVGNPGMASGGMGDVLSGIIGSLAAQRLSLFDAACAGCVVHGAAADAVAARTGKRGLLASDLFAELFQFVNPEMLNSRV